MRSTSRFTTSARLLAAFALFLTLFGSGATVFADGTPQAAPQAAAAQTAPDQTGPVRRLTADQAVTMALEQNLGLRAERLGPQIQSMNVAQSRGAFVPNFFSNFQTRSDEYASRSFIFGAAPTITDEQVTSDFGLRQNLPVGGGSYEVSWQGLRSTTTGFTSYNPQRQTTFSAEVTQPLLRNFKIDSFRQQLLLNQKQEEISNIQLRQAVAQTTRTVRNAYWDLVAAIANHQVQTQSLELARESLRNNRTRVEVGTMAPIDIVEAEAEVARNEEAVIVSEANIRSYEDRLRALIADPAGADFWSMRIEPTDQPIMVPPRTIDVDAAVTNALQNRTDIIQTRKQLETADINVRYYRNQRLPDLNVLGTYGLAGVGGTHYEYGDGFPPPVIGQNELSMFRNQYPSWTLGVTIGYPFGRSQAEAGLARAKLQTEQTQTSIRNLEVQIATAVRDAGRQVNTNLKRVQATQVARQLAEQRLSAEQKKFNVGMSTTFIVFQAQRELTNARNNELRAIIDYNRSLIDFDAIQVVPLGGGGGVVSVANTGQAVQ